MNPKLWPNLISGLRIALMPAVLMSALAGSKPGFVVFLAASLLTDALDGFLARRLNAFTEFGRKLDSAADYLTLTTGLAGIALLWPELMRRELPWIAVGLTAFFGVIVVGLVRLGRPPYYHTWAAKVGVIGCALSLIPLLTEWSAVPFHVMIVLQTLAGVEEIVIILLVPWHEGEIATVWHAWQARRERAARAAREAGEGRKTTTGR